MEGGSLYTEPAHGHIYYTLYLYQRNNIGRWLLPGVYNALPEPAFQVIFLLEDGKKRDKKSANQAGRTKRLVEMHLLAGNDPYKRFCFMQSYIRAIRNDFRMQKNDQDDNCKNPGNNNIIKP